MVLCLGEPSGGFCDGCCCCFYISVLLFHASGTPPWLLRPVKASISSELANLTTFDCFTFPSHFYHKRYGFERASFTLRRFLPYTPSQYLAQPAFIKVSLGAASSSLKVAGPPTEVRNTDAAHLFV